MKFFSDELHQLISNLSLSEKRYCSLYLKKHSAEGDNRYLRLFTILKEQEQYNSEAAIKKLGLSNKPTHYSVLKKQLYEQLLDALHQYDLFTNPEQQLQRGIHQCHLLLQKGLFVQCEKRIKALWAMARDMNQYEAQLQLQNLKMMMKARKYYRQESEEDLKKWWEETNAILNSLATTNRFRYMGSMVYKMQYEAGGRGRESAERMKKIVSQPEFTDEHLATTLRSRLDYLQVRALYHFTNLETELAAEHNERFLKLLDENPLTMQMHADRYFSVLNNYLIDCLVLRKYKTLEEGLEKMRGLSKIPAFRRLGNFDANVFRLGYLLEMNYMITTGNFKQAYTRIKDIQNGLQAFGDKIVKHNRLTLEYLAAYVCFALGKYDEALDNIWPILQEKEIAVAEDIQLAARMMQLLCHFEKGDRMLLESLIKALRRLLRRKDESAEIPKTIVSFINVSLRTQYLHPQQWIDLDKKLEKLAQNKSVAGSLNLFNYLVWVKVHTQQKKFAELWG